jgi:hypothetical protein
VETFDLSQARDNEESKPRHDVTSARERTVESIGINQPGVKMLSVVEKSATIMARTMWHLLKNKPNRAIVRWREYSSELAPE